MVQPDRSSEANLKPVSNTRVQRVLARRTGAPASLETPVVPGRPSPPCIGHPVPSGMCSAWTGGSTYFHRPVPLYMPNYPVNSGHFNYAITYPNSGAEVIARDHGIELVRLPGSPCTPDPGYSWLLP